MQPSSDSFPPNQETHDAHDTCRAGTVARRPALSRPPNHLAEQITGRSYLSHSQISLMRSCPRKFAFRYVEKADSDFIPSSLIFGGSIHTALELHYRCRLEGLGVTH